MASLRKFSLDSIADYEANAHGVFNSFKRMVTSAELGNASEYKGRFLAFKAALIYVEAIFKDHKLGYSVDDLFGIYFKIKSKCHLISKKMKYKKKSKVNEEIIKLIDDVNSSISSLLKRNSSKKPKVLNGVALDVFKAHSKKFRFIPERYHNFYKWHIGFNNGHIQLKDVHYHYDLKSEQGSGAYVKKLIKSHGFRSLEKCEVLIEGILSEFGHLLANFEDNIVFQDDEYKELFASIHYLQSSNT